MARKGEHLSEEHKRKLSEARKGMHPSEETRKKLSEAQSGENNPNYGLSRSEETRRKLSEALSGENHPNYGRHLSEETRRKMSEAQSGEKHPFYGKHHSEETRRKMSEALRGRFGGENHPLYGKHLSEETRRKMSESLRGENGPFYNKHLSEETRRKISELKRGKYPSKETKRRMSEFAIKYGRGLRLAELNQNKYALERNNYASKGECATALALQMYIPGFKIKEGETFQVKCGDDTHGHSIFDFALPNVIVEYHPIVLKNEAYEDHKTYQELKKELPNESAALTDLINDIKEDLAVNYWMERQEIADEYRNGKEVVLVRNEYELYDLIISKYGDKENIPSRSEFAKEFNYMRKLAQPIPKKGKNLEGKVEAA